MKKLLLAVTILLILCTVFAGCETAEQPPEDTEDTTAETIEPAESTTEPESEGTGGESGSMDDKYNFGFYGVESRFAKIVGQEAYLEWVEQSGYFEGKANPNEYNILGFIKYFNISKEDFRAANTPPRAPGYEADSFYTDKEIDALYSGDKNLIAEAFMAPEAINVDGEIYTPRWIAAHSIEEIKAAGITKETLQSKYDEWIETEKIQESSEICIKTKALLENFN